MDRKKTLARKSVLGTTSWFPLLLLVTLQATAPPEENRDTLVSMEETDNRRISDPEELLQIIEAQQEQIHALQQALDELRSL